jgi:hypothetical protein
MFLFVKKQYALANRTNGPRGMACGLSYSRELATKRVDYVRANSKFPEGLDLQADGGSSLSIGTDEVTLYCTVVVPPQC